MGYLALARKWRPRDFSQLVGQEHVVSALEHALDTNHIHHAFLLTGTRGIGKTTIARILAKSLNCSVNGVSSKPCNRCMNCIAVDEGRFIDLIEVDAASRTKVDDTRDLLDNVQYAPTTGEYKIYLIDEVHMLSGHSFNALLKTLEEPPPHVKFVLATTDPQKLPVTVLSRCLQFYLKALSIDQISGQLNYILEQESIAFDHPAIQLLARSAKGSMRDALSLLDQTIAFAGGVVVEEKVRVMLGLVDDQFVFQILHALAQSDVDLLLDVCDQMAKKSVNFVNVLDELLSKFHQISLLQFSPQIEIEAILDKQQLLPFIDQFEKETLQLYYQIALLGKRDIDLAPDMRIGMEMALLRMIAFTLDAVSTITVKSQSMPKTGSLSAQLSDNSLTKQGSTTSLKTTSLKTNSLKATNLTTNNLATQNLETDELIAKNSEKPNSTSLKQKTEVDQSTDTEELVDKAKVQHFDSVDAIKANWSEFVQLLPVTGFTREVVMNCVIENYDEELIGLTVSDSCSHLINDKRQSLIQQAFIEKLNRDIKVTIKLGEIKEKTPGQIAKQAKEERLIKAKQEILGDPSIKELIDELDASIIPGSVTTT